MSDDAFRRFLESEAERNPFRIEGYVNEEEVRRDAERLAKSITPEDYKTIRERWQPRSMSFPRFWNRKTSPVNDEMFATSR